MKKRIISILLLTAFMASIASCGSGQDQPITETTESTTLESETTTESPFEPDDLPELDFKGENINILYRSDVINSFYVKEQNGDIVNDALYSSNRAVEDRLNVKIDPILLSDSNRNDYIAAITNSVSSADEAYDMCGVMTYLVPTLIQQGVCTDLLGVDHIDFDKPWWAAALTELATVDDSLYFVSGDIALEMVERLFCMLFNKDLAATLGTEDIYALVSDGKWTIDKMQELGSSAYSDLNGNGTADSDDRYGVVINDFNHIMGFLGSFEIELTQLDPTDNRQHMAGDTEYVVGAMQKLVEVFNSYDGVMYMSKSDAETAAVATNHDVYRSMFKSDRLLFVTSEFYQISAVYRDMESGYGVIPFPKYEETQDGYYSLSRNVYSSFIIPITCSKLDTVGAFMEATASQNYRDVSPVYFETSLKVKYSRDDISSQMYDLIKAGMKFNFAFTYNGVISNVVNNVCQMVIDNNQNWASKYASFSAKSENTLQKFYDDVENIG